MTVDAAIKLTDKVGDIADRHDVVLKGYDVAREHLKMARRLEGGNVDILSVYGAARVESGMKFKVD